MTLDDSRQLSLTEEAYTELRSRIVHCRLAPGLVVTERQLATELDLGLNPVHLALARLDSEGLVRTLPRRGYQVAPVTIESVSELFQVWRLLGPGIAELAAQKLKRETWDGMVERLRPKLEAAWREKDISAFLQHAEEMWMELAEATGNRRLIAMYVRLVDELRRVFTLIFQDPEAAEVLADLGDYEDAVRQGGPADIRARTELFIDGTHRAVLGILTSWPSIVQAEAVPPVA